MLDGRREQTRLRRLLEARPERDGRERDDTRERSSGRSRRTAPGGGREDRHRDDGEHRPLRIHARGAEREDGETREGRERNGRDPIGLGGIVGDTKMRLDRHERARERQLNGHVHEQRRRPGCREACTDRLQQYEPPDDAAGNSGRCEPEPAAQARERVGCSGHDRQIDHQRPRVRLRGLDQHRHDESAGETETGESGPVQRRCEHGRNRDRAERDERRPRTDEIVQGMRGIDGAEGARGARGRQNSGNMR